MLGLVLAAAAGWVVAGVDLGAVALVGAVLLSGLRSLDATTRRFVVGVASGADGAGRGLSARLTLGPAAFVALGLVVGPAPLAVGAAALAFGLLSVGVARASLAREAVGLDRAFFAPSVEAGC